MARRVFLQLPLAGCAGGRAASPRVHQAPSFTVTERGEGRAVVFVPGVATAGEVWEGAVEHLAGRAQTHTVSIRGFGGGEPAQGPVLARVRAELSAYIRQRALERPVLVGHSLGAALGYWMAACEPALLSGLVAVDAPPYGVALIDPAATGVSYEPTARCLRDQMQRDPDATRAELRRRFSRMTADPLAGERLGEMAARSSPRAVADALYELYTLDLREQAAALQVPVLTLIAADNIPDGQWSTYEPRWRTQVERIPRHQLVVVAGARHFLMLDEPVEFCRHLDAFLAEH